MAPRLEATERSLVARTLRQSQLGLTGAGWSLHEQVALLQASNAPIMAVSVFSPLGTTRARGSRPTIDG